MQTAIKNQTLAYVVMQKPVNAYITIVMVLGYTTAGKFKLRMYMFVYWIFMCWPASGLLWQAWASVYRTGKLSHLFAKYEKKWRKEAETRDLFRFFFWFFFQSVCFLLNRLILLFCFIFKLAIFSITCQYLTCRTIVFNSARFLWNSPSPRINLFYEMSMNALYGQMGPFCNAMKYNQNSPSYFQKNS